MANEDMETFALPLLLTALVGQLPAAVSGNECAACHLHVAQTQSRITHVDQWVTSRHAFYRIGCERCHGGNARTSDRAAAHVGIVNSADRSSAVHRTALPATCGRCHVSETHAFAQSAHFELLSKDDRFVPTCTTCHGSMAADVPSPAVLEQECRRCHADDPQDRAHVARREVEDVAALNSALRRARLEIAGITNADRRMALMARWNDANRSLRTAVADLHAFDRRRVDERLSETRAQVDALTAQLRTGFGR